MLLLLATPPLSLDHMQAPAQLHARRSRSYKREVPAGTPKAAPVHRDALGQRFVLPFSIPIMNYHIYSHSMSIHFKVRCGKYKA